MSFDANGTYTRWEGPDTWQGDASAGTKILADRHDTHDKDIASALSDCLNRRGYGGALANISMGGFKITNLLNGLSLTDAATVDQVKNIPGWDKSKYIMGADLDGRLNFTATSGVNGITWTYADMSWIARHSVASKYGDRLAFNNTKAPNTTGDPVGDVMFIDKSGRINNNGQLTNNLSFDGTNWRAISASTFGSRLQYTGGDFTLASNDIVSAANPYSTVTLRNFFQALNSAGSTEVRLYKSASGKVNYIWGYTGTEPRWRMALGDATAESGTGRVGSNFTLVSYDNAGANAQTALTVDRGAGLATLHGDVKISGTTTINSYLYSSDTDMILQPANNGQVLIRADGTDVNHQTVFDNVGSIRICNLVAAAGGGLYAGAGLRAKLGSAGAYGSWWINFNWTGAALNVYTSTGLLGAITGSWCDYRIKKDITPLPSMWDRVKALKPIRYTQAAFQMFDDNDDEQWGFLAHEVQDSLGSTMATGEKDGPDVQGLNLLGVIAGLTRALQEAMARIEALEAAP